MNLSLHSHLERMPFKVWGASGQVLDEIKSQRQSRQAKGNIRRRMGGQRYVVGDWIYAYQSEDIEKNKVKKLGSK